MKGVVITGGSRGLGAGLFRRLAASSCLLIPIGRSELPWPTSASAEVRPIKLDLRSLADAERWIWLSEELAASVSSSGLSGLLFVNNAGTVQPIGGLDESEPEAIADATLVNFTAPLAILRALLQVARARTVPLHVTNMTSGASQRPIGGWSAYCGTKAGVRMALDAAQRTYPELMTVNHIDPGALEGAMQEEIRATQSTFPDRDMFVRWKEEGRLRPIEEAAEEIFINELAVRL